MWDLGGEAAGRVASVSAGGTLGRRVTSERATAACAGRRGAVGRFANSLELTKASWGVLKADKELATIPVVSFVVSGAVTLLVAGSMWFTLDVQTATTAGSDEYSPTPITYAVGFVGYLLITFVVTFFTGALVSGALQRFRGTDPTLASSFEAASKHLVPLFWWSMLSGTVGYLLQLLEQRAGFIGQLVVRAVGMAWQVVTWLAIPVIVDQGTGPIDSLKQSAGLFRKTWGENLIAQAGLGIIGMLVMLPGIVLGVALMAALPILGVVVLVVWIAAVSVVISSLNGILRTAVYLYATGQQVPQFPTAALAGAFGPRKGKLG